MVLVHGGGGTAFAQWVRQWNARGYAAIAMDTCGCVPVKSDKQWKRDDQGGSPGWGGFDQIEQAAGDQWTCQAVLDVILAHSLIRSWPQVDADRIGLTGISWGGYLTCIVAGLDDRFKFACPVYGCGFLGEDSGWLDDFKNLGAAKSSRWLSAWDPSEYLAGAKMPMLWVDGTNDRWYPPDSLQKSYHLPSGPRTLVMRVAMKHGHEAGWAPEEIGAFADALCKNGIPLATIKSQESTENIASASYESLCPIVKAELNFTTDTGVWLKRKWQTQPADLLTNEKKVRVALPADVTAFYMNLTDEKGRIVSTELTIH
jgi:dienelactone hydrolase